MILLLVSKRQSLISTTIKLQHLQLRQTYHIITQTKFTNLNRWDNYNKEKITIVSIGELKL